MKIYFINRQRSCHSATH